MASGLFSFLVSSLWSGMECFKAFYSFISSNTILEDFPRDVAIECCLADTKPWCGWKVHMQQSFSSLLSCMETMLCCSYSMSTINVNNPMQPMEQVMQIMIIINWQLFLALKLFSGSMTGACYEEIVAYSFHYHVGSRDFDWAWTKMLLIGLFECGFKLVPV